MRGLRYSPALLMLVWTLPLGAQETSGSTQPGAEIRRASGKEKVTGIGGFFFRSRDPKALSQWYLTHLGISLTPTSYEETPWRQEAGPTVFAPFPRETDYFGKPEQVWMINFRVRDLDRMIKQLKAAGIAVKLDPEQHPNGRFARIHDPEGNPIELWEPQTPPAPEKRRR
jgi:glyoxylase I family protein